MAEPVPAGSDVSSGTYSCTQCGYELDVSSTKHLPPCPSCGNAEWRRRAAATPSTTRIPIRASRRRRGAARSWRPMSRLEHANRVALAQ